MRLGKAFADFVNLGQGSRYRQEISSKSWLDTNRWWRAYCLFLVFLLGFIVLEARLFHLAIITGSGYRNLSEANRTRERLLPAPRGIIFDQNKQQLVQNVPLYLGQDDECEEKGYCRWLSPYKDGQKLTLTDSLAPRVGRFYPYGGAFAHLLGYIGEVGKEELLVLNRHCPQRSFCRVGLGELAGRGGAEEYWDEPLRGISGRELVEVDALAKPIRVLAKKEPDKGENLILTIDKELQLLSMSNMVSSAGAIIASQPLNGELMAIVSAPSYDPNLFAGGDEEVEELLKRPDRPLFNRAISGLYPPGSTFKLVTAVAGLQAGKITAETQIEDVGEIRIGPYRFGNWYFTQYGKTEGLVTIVRAIARSNDIFFYKVGEMVGSEVLSQWSRQFGLGEKTGIDLPGEETGLVPNPVWKKETQGKSWFLGDTYHLAIGQGDLLVTPLQVNTWTNVVANGGKLCRPRVKLTLTASSEVAQQSSLRLAGGEAECQDLGLERQTIKLIKQGMREACQPGGTGWPLFKFKVKSEKLKVDGVNFLESPQASISGQPWVEIPVACKTGTAEYGDPKGRTHAWFTAFAPIENPEISVTVLVEGGGEGSSVAGPIAKKILEYWFSR